MTRTSPLILTLAAAFAVAAPAQAAPAKFKADVYIHQSSEWAASWATPVICGKGYQHTFRGDGTGSVTYQAKNVPVTFKKRRGIWQTNDFGLRGRGGRQSGFEVLERGNPDGCAPGWAKRPDPPDTSGCGGIDVKKSSKSFWLMIVGGQLMPMGAFTGADGGDPLDSACPDMSLKTAVVESVPSPDRRDVHRLITRKNVRSIELRSGKSYFGGPLTTEMMGFPGGVEQAGEGEFQGRWHIKLTRVR